MMVVVVAIVFVLVVFIVIVVVVSALLVVMMVVFLLVFFVVMVMVGFGFAVFFLGAEAFQLADPAGRARGPLIAEIVGVEDFLKVDVGIVGR